MSAPEITRVPGDGVYLQTEFLERIAHELRGPAGVTSGSLDEIERILGPDAEKLRAFFLIARRGMQRVLRTAERLERTAQLERGEIDWAKGPTDLRDLVARAAKDTELLEARRNVRVSVSCSAEACPVLADPAWIVGAIAEVAANAIRFARSVVWIRTEASAGEAKITIIDDGRGFAGPAAPRFERPTSHGGVGLSLRFACDVVALHGGRVEIDGSRKHEDNEPSGAHVALFLPLLKVGDT